MRWIINLLLALLGPHKEHTPERKTVMPGYDKNVLAAMLRRHEGYENRLYFDSEGILTVGTGHALGYHPVPAHIRKFLQQPGVMDRPFSNDALDAQFADDLAPAEKEAQTLAELRNVDFEALSPRRQMVLVDMTFNLGSDRLGRFVRMWGALAEGEYSDAAAEMLDSKWARQVGVRAQELAAMMREG